MRDVLQSHFGGTKPKTSLEVGCGRGVMSKYLMKDGVETTGMDILPKFRQYNENFILCNAIASIRSDDGKRVLELANTYDIVFTYGLIEHIDHLEMGILESRCYWMCKPGGIILHYAVPRKLTNITSNKSVKRYDLGWMKYSGHEQHWVYPIFSWMDWKTNKWFGRGFWIWETV